MKNDKIQSIDFYKAWFESVNERKDLLLNIWRNFKEFTSYIKGAENCIIESVAQKLNLLCYPKDYYCIDAVLYKAEDLVDKKAGEFWFKDIRVAFEHENNFKGGLYQEISHLLIVNADLKVLVTYPNEETETELEYLHQIITTNRQAEIISAEESFLLIFGYESEFEWEGFVYKKNGWKKLAQPVTHVKRNR